MNNDEILNRFKECFEQLSNKTRKSFRPYCITTAKDSDYVNEWVKKYHIPFNGMFLTRGICDYITKQYKDIFNGNIK